jgi:hypothetical protein
LVIYFLGTIFQMSTKPLFSTQNMLQKLVLNIFPRHQLEEIFQLISSRDRISLFVKINFLYCFL